MTVGGRRADKAATQVDAAAAVVVTDPEPSDAWVGRVLASWTARSTPSPRAAGSRSGRTRVPGRRRASTGGFTQMLLARGAQPRARGGRRLRAARLAPAGRTSGWWCTSAPTSVSDSLASLDPAPSPRRGRPVVHLARARPARARGDVRAGGRAAAHGQAAVRGRPGQGRHRRGSSATRVCGPTRSCPSSRPPTGSVAARGGHGQPAARPSGNVEYFVLLAPGTPGTPERVRDEVARAVADGPVGAWCRGPQDAAPPAAPETAGHPSGAGGAR